LFVFNQIYIAYKSLRGKIFIDFRDERIDSNTCIQLAGFTCGHWWTHFVSPHCNFHEHRAVSAASSLMQQHWRQKRGGGDCS